MRQFAFAAALAALAGGWVFAFPTQHALATMQFKNAFEAKYAKADSTDPAEQKLTAEVKQAKCNVCHMGNTKKMRNAYGAALDKLLDKAEKDPVKITEALDKVASEKSDPENAASPTFGDLLKQGKLPGAK